MKNLFEEFIIEKRVQYVFIEYSENITDVLCYINNQLCLFLPADFKFPLNRFSCKYNAGIHVV